MKNLYLGSSFNAYDKEEVLNNKINVIFNITVEIPNFHENIIYYNYPIKDNGIENITQILLTASNKIHYHICNGDTILVHCYMGASRSASVIIYYLMKYHKINLKNALCSIKNKRAVVNLTEKFYDDLKQLE